MLKSHLQGANKLEHNDLLPAQMAHGLPDLLAAGGKNWGRSGRILASFLCTLLYSGMKETESQPPRCVGRGELEAGFKGSLPGRAHPPADHKSPCAAELAFHTNNWFPLQSWFSKQHGYSTAKTEGFSAPQSNSTETM